MLERRTAGPGFEEMMRVKIIDFGSARFIEGPVSEEDDDCIRFARHIADFYNFIKDREDLLTKADRRLLETIPQLVDLMLDPNPLRRLRVPRDIYTEYGALKIASGMPPSKPGKLEDPFAFISAEEIRSEAMFHQLFSKEFPWYSDIEGPSAATIVGPRGCGKSMIFRSMRMKTKLLGPKPNTIRGDSYVGFVVPCNAEFSLRFSHLPADLLKRRAREIIHFFNMIVAREILTSLDVAQRNVPEIVPIDSNGLWRAFELVRPVVNNGSGEAFLQHMSPLVLTASLVSEEIERTYDAISKDDPIQRISQPTFLRELVELLRQELGFLRDRTFFFLLDDYSVPKVPKAIQEVLNVIVWDRNPLYRFKVSCSPFGLVPSTQAEDFSLEEREYIEINLGTEYMLREPTRLGANFLADVIDRRLRPAGIKKSIRDILGPSVYPKSSLGKSLKDESSRRSTYYHGFDCVVNLCSGDVSTMLGLCREIFAGARRQNVDLEGPDPIAPTIQHTAITTFSRRFLRQILDIPVHGRQLFQIVNAFGTISQQLLYHHPGVAKGEGRPLDPYELLRIEVDERFPLKDETERTFRCLQKWDIFIDAAAGRSRRMTLSRKVVLRKIFCPAFKTTLSSSESMTLSAEELKWFLTEPEYFKKRYLERRLPSEEGDIEEAEQLWL